MKKRYNTLLLIMTFLLIVAGCKDEETLDNIQVTPVSNLYAPENNTYFNLGAQSSAVFEWEAAKAEDNGVVLYDVAFDTEEGDFSSPLYVLPSDGNGLQRVLTLPFADLNKIAGMAGIQPESTGKLKWTVLSSKGINVQESAISRMIEVERPAGFPPPDELYITGTATEAGDDLTKAILMKKTSTSTFEVYTSLKAGEYHFATRNSGTPETYFIEEGKLKADGATTYAGADSKVYRIRVDFSNGTTEIAEIETVELWFSPRAEFLFGFNYAGNGTWEALAQPIEFYQETWGRDERYKFRFTVNKDGNLVEEWFGSVNKDNQRPNETTGDDYWYMVPTNNHRYDYSFKFGDAVDMATVDIKIFFNTTVPAYTHTVTVK